MQRFRSVALAVVIPLLLCGLTARAETLGTSFTYQGELVLDDTLVNETCDFEFSLWDTDGDPDAGTEVCAALPKTVEVVGGRFTVELDFGSDCMSGEARWLEIDVCCPSACAPGYSTLDPRQKLSPSPHAIRASTGVGGPNALNVDANGNVGIGTTGPLTRKLDVNGDLQATAYFGDGSNLTGIPSIPSGIIVMWSGTRATIPPGWVLCDGTNGTPDLQERFVYGVLNTEDPGAVGGSASHTHSEEYPDRHWRVLSNVQYPTGGHVECADTWCLPDYEPTPRIIEDEGAQISRIIGIPGPGIGTLSDVGECFPDANTCPVVSGGSRRNVTWHRAYKQGMSTEDHLPSYYKLAFIMKL